MHGGSGVSFGVIEALRAARPDEKLELVHRLDRDTSGLLLVARKPAALRTLHALLREGQVEKRYLALVKGKWELGKKRIDVPLRTDIRVGGERTVKAHASGKEAASVFKPVQFFGKQASLVEVSLETGRTHQIRVHAAHAGYPVAGDEKYGDAEFNERMKAAGLKRMFLHAHQLSFVWPETGVEFSARARRCRRIWPRSIDAAGRPETPRWLGHRVARAAQGAGQPDQRQSDNGGGVLRFHALEQRDAQRLGLESAGAVEGLLAFDVAVDLRVARACAASPSWCRRARA